jgi:glycosyltransferase involved in cell wall biosynthesis
MGREVEPSALDLRYESYRMRNPAVEGRLLASIPRRGIEEPLEGELPHLARCSDMSKRVLMATTDFWEAPTHVGSHHFAKAFANQGWDVCYLSSPISPFHVLKSSSLFFRSRFRNYIRGGIRHAEGRIWTYVPGGPFVPAGPLKSEWAYKNWWKCSVPSLLKKLQKNGFGEVDLIYFDNPLFSFLSDVVRTKSSIFRVMDNNAAFPGASRTIIPRERELASKVDLVIYSAFSLERYVQNLNPRKAMHFGNGVDYRHFAKPTEIPVDIRDLKKPIVIYVGALAAWFDFQLVENLARTFPHCSFVLIGNDRLARQKLSSENIVLLGARPYSQIPDYLQAADVGIIPFDVQGFPDLIHQVNPLKLYEYLASGLPVVSVEWEELRRLNPPAFLARTSNDFAQHLEAALKHTGDRSALKDYAQGFDWNQKINQLTEQLGLN